MPLCPVLIDPRRLVADFPAGSGGIVPVRKRAPLARLAVLFASASRAVLPAGTLPALVAFPRRIPPTRHLRCRGVALVRRHFLGGLLARPDEVPRRLR